MEIKIIDENASQKHIQSAALIAEFHKKQTLKTVLLQSIIAIILITYDIATFDQQFWKVGAGNDVKYYNLHLALGFGLAFILGIISTLRTSTLAKNKYISNAYNLIKLQFEKINKETITITKDSIKSENENLKIEIDWVLISSFMINEDFIYLIRNSSFASSIIIDKKLLKENENNELITFLKQIKPETKSYSKPI